MIKSVLVASDIKDQAKSLQRRLKSIGVQISLQQAYEGLSASYGARNWHTLKSEVVVESSPPKLKNKVYLFMDFWSDDEYLELPEYGCLDLSNVKTMAELWKSHCMCKSGLVGEAVNEEVSFTAISSNTRVKYEDCHVDNLTFWFAVQDGFSGVTAKTSLIYFDTLRLVLEQGKLPESLKESSRHEIVKVRNKKGEDCFFLFWSNYNTSRLKHLIASNWPLEHLSESFDAEELFASLSN